MDKREFFCAPNCVVVRKLENEGVELFKKSTEGVYSKSDVAKLEYKGEVLLVGKDLQSWIKPGDIISHGIHGGTAFVDENLVEGEVILSLKDYEILSGSRPKSE